MVVHTPFNPSKQISDFQSILVHRTSSRIAKATWRNPVSENPGKGTKVADPVLLFKQINKRQAKMSTFILF